ncbi:MAG TPA: DNA-directed RNA polymerase subunit F [archaeon]|nr:DNA-directed RNA polymerase subunit F [archaeon]
MIGKEVVSKRVVPLSEVKAILKKISEERAELSYEQKLTFEYSKKFSKLTEKQSEKLLEELKKIDGVDEEFALKVADILPESMDVMNLLIPKGAKISDKAVDEAFELVKKSLK